MAAGQAFCSDARCIETYEALADRASDYRNIELEIRALFDWSYCLSLIHADRSLEPSLNGRSDSSTPWMMTSCVQERR